MLSFLKMDSFSNTLNRLKKENSLAFADPSPPDALRGRVIAFKRPRRPPPKEKIPETPLPPEGSLSFSPRNYKWILILFSTISKKLNFYWNFKFIFKEKSIKNLANFGNFLGLRPKPHPGLCPCKPLRERLPSRYPLIPRQTKILEPPVVRNNQFEDT